jgi:accessory gene regulator B
MSNIEKLSQTVASKISNKLSMNDQDKEEVLAYGAFVLFQTILSIIMVAVFGIIFDVLVEALIISFASSILRKSSGGAHASSPMNCGIISVIIFGGLALLVKHYILVLHLYYLTAGICIAFFITYFIMFKYSPVGTVNKPLKNENKRMRLKKLSLITVHIYLLISFVFIIIYFQTGKIFLLSTAICISVGAMWQSMTMVSLGHMIIDGLDKVLRGANQFIRRENQ